MALAFVGSAGFILLEHHKESWTLREARVGDKILADFPYNEVASIHIKGESDLNIVREDGVWRVRERENHPANYQQVKDLLLRIKNVKVLQSESVGPSQLGRVDLDQPGEKDGGGILLEFKNEQGRVLDSLLVGKMHLRKQEASVPFGLHGLFDGRYVLLPKDPQNVLLVSDELSTVAPEPAAWLSRDFFKVQNVQFLSLTSTNPANSWSLWRKGESWPWTLLDLRPNDGEVLDTNIAYQTGETLGFFNFVDVIASNAPAAIGPNKPMVVTIGTFDNFTYTLKFGAKRPDGNYPMLVSVNAKIPSKRVPKENEDLNEAKELDRDFRDETRRRRERLEKERALAEWVYLVEPSSVEPLTRDRAEILAKKTVVSENANTNQIPFTVTQ